MRIIIDCNPFLTTSHAYYIEDFSDRVENIETISNDFLVEHIANRAKTMGVKYIGLQGLNNYCEGIKEDLQAKMATEYANNDIEIEVI